jgi:hypothetical protein
LYINGVLNNQSTPGAIPADSGCDLFIGGFYVPPAGYCQYWGQFFNGVIDEVSLYRRALSLSEIQSIYNAGSAGKCVPNQPPVADASATSTLVISPPCTTNAPFVLDGTRSFDPEGNALDYVWREGSNVLATGALVTVTLPAGTHVIELEVSDGSVTDTDSITVQVITPAQAVDNIVAAIHESDISHQQSLIATLSAAIASIDRCNAISAINQLRAFQNKVLAQVAPLDPELAVMLIQQAQEIIDILAEAVRPHHVQSRNANGKAHLKFSGAEACAYVVEASTNLLDWQVIGEARCVGANEFEFEDVDSSEFSSRYYRIVAP